ncbi:Crp/Fnr family transcriptional regulator [Parasulfuritortus cantonensis]|uniref:Crp/Fnr family transcriptional regulator n=1 Tax=Parasulfuritortus cantonensis TaxID=2528202 RepID=A0A4V2NW83_9PROT|nr:Crp/Fnr family transcriptional regulator [Parasulfuritortus cantonensis]TCJ16362.1 Crp/Fnr family transcriptional regulator [Parasulfuritortus cantonensis]
MILETRHSIAEILSRQPLFRNLGRAELGRLAESTLEYRVGKHEVLFQKGDRPAGLYLIVTGQIKLILPSPQGTEKVVRLASPGEAFAEEAVIPDGPHAMTAEALRDSILLIVPRPALMAALAESTCLCCDLMAGMARRMQDLIDNMESCSQRSSDQRVAHYLTQLAPVNADSFEVELGVNKQHIASHLDLAPETFSRVLSRLARQGYIQMHGRTIRVADAEQLRLQAC